MIVARGATELASSHVNITIKDYVVRNYTNALSRESISDIQEHNAANLDLNSPSNSDEAIRAHIAKLASPNPSIVVNASYDHAHILSSFGGAKDVELVEPTRPTQGLWRRMFAVWGQPKKRPGKSKQQTKDELDEKKDEVRETKHVRMRTKDEAKETKQVAKKTKDEPKKTRDEVRETKHVRKKTKDEVKTSQYVMVRPKEKTKKPMTQRQREPDLADLMQQPLNVKSRARKIKAEAAEIRAQAGSMAGHASELTAVATVMEAQLDIVKAQHDSVQAQIIRYNSEILDATAKYFEHFMLLFKYKADNVEWKAQLFETKLETVRMEAEAAERMTPFIETEADLARTQGNLDVTSGKLLKLIAELPDNKEELVRMCAALTWLQAASTGLITELREYSQGKIIQPIQ